MLSDWPKEKERDKVFTNINAFDERGKGLEIWSKKETDDEVQTKKTTCHTIHFEQCKLKKDTKIKIFLQLLKPIFFNFFLWVFIQK